MYHKKKKNPTFVSHNQPTQWDRTPAIPNHSPPKSTFISLNQGVYMCPCLGATGDMGSIPESGRSPGGGNSKAPQYSCLENPMDRGAWRVTVHEVAESDLT